MFIIETFLFICLCIVGVIAMKRGFGIVSLLTNKFFDWIDGLVSSIFGS